MVKMKNKKRMKENEGAERRIDINKYIAVTATAILIFILGISLGSYLAGSRLEYFEKTQQELTTMLKGLELKDELLEQGDICVLTWDDVWKEKVDMGKKMSYLESRFGKDNKDIIEQKKIYELIEIRTLLLLEKIKQECKEDLITILFFYTNNKDDEKGSWKKCSDQGYILDAVYKQDPRINIFSFDINIKNPATDTLRQNYNITKVPSLVIEGKLYEGRMSLESIKELV